MRLSTFFIPACAAAALALGTAKPASAQIAVQIGPAPVCPYGYYDYPPYQCAPYGYYGPEWFDGGVFLGAGPWFHGHHDFYGHVDRRYDPHYGYHGDYPRRGEGFREPHDHWNNFHGSEMRDGRGHERGGEERGGGRDGDHRH